MVKGREKIVLTSEKPVYDLAFRERGRIRLSEVDDQGKCRVIGFFNSYSDIGKFIEKKRWKNRVFYAMPKNILKPMSIRRVDFDKFGLVWVEGYGAV